MPVSLLGVQLERMPVGLGRGSTVETLQRAGPGRLPEDDHRGIREVRRRAKLLQ